MCVKTMDRVEEAGEWNCVAEKETLGGREIILFVEDEGFVREVTSQVLRSAGYRVLTATNAAEALHLYDQRSNEVGLLLTDVVLPGDWTGVGRQTSAKEPGTQYFVGHRVRGADGAARWRSGGMSGEAIFLGGPAAESEATAGSQQTSDRNRRIRQARLR